MKERRVDYDDDGGFGDDDDDEYGDDDDVGVKWKRGGVTGGLALPRVSIRLPILLPTLSTELDHDDLDADD